MKNILEPVLFGKLAVTGSQFLIIILSPLVMVDEEVNQLFSLLAWAAILCAFISFGGNAALAKHLRIYGEVKASAFVTVIVVGKFIVLLLLCLIGRYLSFFGDVRLDLLFCTAFTASLSFVDYVAEAYGKDYLEKFSLVKIIVFGTFSIIKFVFLYVSPSSIFFLLYIEWLVVWLILYMGFITKRKGLTLSRFHILDVKAVYLFVKSSSWVWLSSIFQLGWTRGFFIILTRDIGGASANQFYFFIRIIEAFAFIPNALSMKYFSEVLHAKKPQVKNIRTLYIDRLKVIGLCIAILSPLSMYLINIFILEISINFSYYLIIALAGLIYVLRVGLSREIILRKVLHLSLVSYLTAMIFSFTFYEILGSDSLLDALMSYLVFVIICFITPFLSAPQVFNDFRISLLGLRREE